MNPLSMESIFLILSGVILASGVLYWFWSHIQMTQKKVQLLENAVFELRGLMGGSSYAGAVPVYSDLSDDDWQPVDETSELAPATATAPAPATVPATATTFPSRVDSDDSRMVGLVVSDDLQPGGMMPVSAPFPEGTEVTEVTEVTGATEATEATDASQFRALFSQDEGSGNQGRTSESLENMPVRELRRLAEQRGLTGVADMKKKEILSALRAQITTVESSPAETVVVEKTLDLETLQ